MRDPIATIRVITILIVLLGGFPYGVWMILTALKKRWMRLLLQAGIPVGMLLLLQVVFMKVNEGAHEEDLHGLFDTKVRLGDPIFEFNSPRSFNGDGYSLAVYELPSAIRSRFEAADERLLAEFPQHPSHQDFWRIERWRRSPSDGTFSKYLDFALSNSVSARHAGLAGHFGAIRLALAGGGSYYGCFHYDHGDTPGDINLFIVDLAGNRLYLINHNT